MYIYPNTLSIFRNDYESYYAYRVALRDARRHYDFCVRVDGGMKFFEFEDDYLVFKSQK